MGLPERDSLDQKSVGIAKMEAAADNNDPLGVYYGTLKDKDPLPDEEVINLAQLIEQGLEAERDLSENSHSSREKKRLKRLIGDGQAAGTKLTEHNLHLVVSVAKKFEGPALPLLDMIQAGNEGLMRAVKGYDYHRGFKFSTYATWWIRQAIGRAIIDQGQPGVRLPVHLYGKVNRLFRRETQLKRKLGPEITKKELAERLAEEMDKPVEEIERLKAFGTMSRLVIPLDHPIKEKKDKEGDTWGEIIEDKNAPSLEEEIDYQRLQAAVEVVLDELTPKEAWVISLRFGLNGEEPHSLQEVGDKMGGLTREGVRQIEIRAKRRLRHPRRARKLKPYLRLFD